MADTIPSGTMLSDGYPVTISFELAAAVHMKEVEVTPPAAEMGGPIPQTNQRNQIVMTQLPKKLRHHTGLSGLYHYDPAVLSDIENQLGKNQLLKVTYADGAAWQIYGWLDKFAPSRMKYGDKPAAECTFEISNIHRTTGAETRPVYVAPSTTVTVTTVTLP